MVPTRALAAPVAGGVDGGAVEAPRGRAIGKDEVEKRGFPDAAPSETNRIHRTRDADNRIECMPARTVGIRDA